MMSIYEYSKMSCQYYCKTIYDKLPFKFVLHKFDIVAAIWSQLLDFKTEWLVYV